MVLKKKRHNKDSTHEECELPLQYTIIGTGFALGLNTNQAFNSNTKRRNIYRRGAFILQGLLDDLIPPCPQNLHGSA